MIATAYFTHYANHSGIVKPCILAALKHERAEAQSVTLVAAVEYLLVGEAVAYSLLLASPQTTIKAVVPTVTGNLYQSSDEHFFSIN